jgi:GDP-L-fucose synthase
MVGAALVRRLQLGGQQHLLLRGRAELDLTRQSEVEQFFADERIHQVYLAAALVGGIKANNDRPAEFITENLLIQTTVRSLPVACRAFVSSAAPASAPP